MAIYSGMGQIMGTAILTQTKNLSAHQSDGSGPSVSPDDLTTPSTSVNNAKSQLPDNTTSHLIDESNQASTIDNFTVFQRAKSNQAASLERAESTTPIDNPTLLQRVESDDFDEFFIEMDHINQTNRLEKSKSQDEGFQSRSPSQLTLSEETIDLSEMATGELQSNVESRLPDTIDPQSKAPYKNVRPKWTEIERHSTKKENDEYIKSHNFSATYSTKNKAGVESRYYRCNKVQKKGTQCAAKLKVVLPSDKIVWIVEKNELDHTCRNIENKVPLEVRAKADVMRRERIQPSKMHAVLQREFGEKAPTLTQIYHMNRKVDADGGTKFTSLGPLTEWMHEHTTINEADDSFPFVLDYKHSSLGETAHFQYVISTPRLLKNAMNFRIVSADGTYKVNKHDYPLIVVGGIDITQRFHIIAFSVTTREETSNYKCVFTAIKSSIWNLFHKKWEPEVIISDAAGAISKGFREAFPQSNKKTIMCWFHVMQAVTRKLGINDYSNEVKADINKIHLSPSAEVFARYMELFENKWKDRLPKFCEYFRKYWGDQHSGWYTGYAQNCPSTNNGAEGYNSHIKRDLTLRELLEMGDLNNALFREVQMKSRAYQNDEIRIPENKEISNDLWMSAKQWMANDVPTLLLGNITYITSSASSNSGKEITRANIDDLNNLEGTNFDELAHLIASIWKMRFDSTDFENSECTCPQWTSSGLCKHVVGTAIALDILEFPARLNDAKLRQPNKRKPLTKASKALKRQPFYDHDSASLTSVIVRTDQTTDSHCTNEKSTIIDNQSSSPSSQVQTQSTFDAIAEINVHLLPSTTSDQNATGNCGHKKPTIIDIESSLPSSQVQLPPSTFDAIAEINAHPWPSTKSIETAKRNKKGSKTASNGNYSSLPLMPSGTLLIFGDSVRDHSVSGQFMCPESMKWTSLPLISSLKSKVAAHNASFTHIGQNRIFMTGGVERQTLKRVSSLFLIEIQSDFFLSFLLLEPPDKPQRWQNRIFASDEFRTKWSFIHVFFKQRFRCGWANSKKNYYISRQHGEVQPLTNLFQLFSYF